MIKIDEDTLVTSEKVWLIMDVGRTVVAKGTPRNRHLIAVNDKKDKKRYLTYKSEGTARNASTSSGFYAYGLEKQSSDYVLEPVEANLTLIIPKKKNRFEKLAEEV